MDLRNAAGRGRGSRRYGLRAAASSAELPAAQWNALGRSLYLAPEWLAIVEDDPGITSCYLLAEERVGGTVVGGLPVYVSEGDGNPFYDPFRLFLERCDDADRSLWVPTLLFGTAAGYTNELPLDPSLALPEREEVITTLVGRGLDVGAAGGARSAWFLYLTPDAAREVSAVLEHAPVLLTDLCAVLDIEWTSFDDYVTSLSANTRSVLRREIRRFHNVGYQLGVSPLGALVERVAPLVRNVLRKYGNDVPEQYIVNHLDALARHLSDRAVAYTCTLDGELAAAAVAVQWEHDLYVRAWGFDYERLVGANEYFLVSIYAPIRHAIAEGLGSIHFGSDSIVAKARRGAHLETRWSALVAGPPAWLDRAEGERLNELKWAEWQRLYGPALVESVRREVDAPPSRDGTGGSCEAPAILRRPWGG